MDINLHGSRNETYSMVQNASFGFIYGIESSLWQSGHAQIKAVGRQDLLIVVLVVLALALDDRCGSSLIDWFDGRLVAHDGREVAVESCHFFLCTTDEESIAERGCRMRLLIERDSNAVSCL
jgi:hypothetical protein